MIKSREYSLYPDSPAKIFDAEWYGGKIMKVEREGQFFYQSSSLSSSTFTFNATTCFIEFLNPADGSDPGATIDAQPEKVRVIFKI